MSNGGGLLQLRNAGFDHLVVLGKAAHPVYIKITNSKVEIIDARHLWGKDTYETTETLWKEFGDHYEVAAIGPAGENLVRSAGIIGDTHVAWGRTGLGAVMGSKHLKALVVSGTQQVDVAYPTKLLNLSKKSTQDITGDTTAIETWRTGGTWKWGHNSERPSPRAPSEVFDLDKYDSKLEHHPVACPGCPVGCKHALRIKPGLKHSGLEFVLGCTSGTMCGPFGGGLGVIPIEEVAKCAEIVQRLGMDSATTAGLISFAIELYEAGLITAEDTRGLELRWSDEELVIKMMHMIANREGIGDLLAEGTERVIEVIPEAVKYSTAWKGMERATTSPGGTFGRELGTANLAWALNYRGHMDRHRYPFKGGTPDQPESGIQALFKRAGHLGIPEEAMVGVSQVPEEAAPWGMRYVQDYNTVAYTLGLCDRPVILNALPIDRMTELYNHATGLDVTSEHLLRAARRIWNMEKVWVTMQGQTRKADYPPSNDFDTDYVFKMDYQGEPGTYPHVELDVYEQVLDRYYKAEGWEQDTGLPLVKTLEDLDLDWMVDDYKSFRERQEV